MDDDIKIKDEPAEEIPEEADDESGADEQIGEESPEDEGVELTMAGRSAVRQKKSRARDVFEEDEDAHEGDGQLTIDVYQTSDEIIIESPIAGVRPEDLDISITAESVTIKGSRHHERKAKEEDYFYQETYWGRFSRSVILPQEVDAERSDASVKNGVLTIRLPKLNRQKSKKIKVNPSG